MPASMLGSLLPLWVEAKDLSLLTLQLSILTTAVKPHIAPILYLQRF